MAYSSPLYFVTLAFAIKLTAADKIHPPKSALNYYVIHNAQFKDHTYLP